MLQERKFTDVFVKGLLHLTGTRQVSIRQQFFGPNNEILRVKSRVQKNGCVHVLNCETGKEFYIPVRKLKKVVMYVSLENEGGAIRAYDVNLTRLNKDRILANIGKYDFGFLNCVDTIKPEFRFNKDGSEKIEMWAKGYRRFIRLCSEEKIAQRNYSSSYIRMLQVKQVYRNPYPAEQIDAFVSLKNDELIISSGQLKGSYIKLTE